MGYRRKVIEKRKLKKLYLETKNGYGAGAWYGDRRGYYYKYSVGSPEFKRYLKKRCSKVARQHKDILNNSKYKRTYDYYWELY